MAFPNNTAPTSATLSPPLQGVSQTATAFPNKLRHQNLHKTHATTIARRQNRTCPETARNMPRTWPHPPHTSSLDSLRFRRVLVSSPQHHLEPTIASRLANLLPPISYDIKTSNATTIARRQEPDMPRDRPEHAPHPPRTSSLDFPFKPTVSLRFLDFLWFSPQHHLSPPLQGV